MTGTWKVTKKKLAGHDQIWSAFLLGRDDYGTWLYAVAGTPVHTARREQIGTLQRAGAQLIPVDGWWVAWWWDNGSVTVDIATPANLRTDSVSYLDLELDLWADQHGGHGLVDQDEYDSARVAGLITDEEHLHATLAAEDIDRRLAGRVEPFGQVGWSWFSGVTHMS